jgi:exopolyphosphatase/guanosine-5'-triphosphate,3'-diphosphate pyrophosphatase
LVLGQRGGLRKLEPTLREELAAWQTLCLRLAIIKCHARNEINNAALALRRNGRRAELKYTAAWAQGHPRTVYLLREEASGWEKLATSLSLILPR